jgi:hypothetical protein
MKRLRELEEVQAEISDVAAESPPILQRRRSRETEFVLMSIAHHGTRTSGLETL